jgi:hypothetical protein
MTFSFSAKPFGIQKRADAVLAMIWVISMLLVGALCLNALGFGPELGIGSF